MLLSLGPERERPSGRLAPMILPVLFLVTSAIHGTDRGLETREVARSDVICVDENGVTSVRFTGTGSLSELGLISTYVFILQLRLSDDGEFTGHMAVDDASGRSVATWAGSLRSASAPSSASGGGGSY